MTLPSTWPFRPQDISTAPKEKRMAQVDARKAGKPYKEKQQQDEQKPKVAGRKDRDGACR